MKGDSKAKKYAITVNNSIRKIIIPSIMLIFIPANLHFFFDILGITNNLLSLVSTKNGRV